MSSPVIETVTDVQTKVLEAAEKVQAPVVDVVREAVSRVEGRLPALPTVSFAEKLPTADEVVAAQHTFARKVIDNQRDFATALIEAVRPVSAKLVVVSAPPAAPRKTRKAA